MPNHTIHSIRWTVSTAIIRRGLTFVVFLLMMYVLQKDDLGLFNQYSRVIACLLLFAHLSLDSLYIVETKKQESVIQALFQISVIMGVVSLPLLWFGSPLIASLYHSRALGYVMRLLLPLIGIELLRVAAKAKAQRQLRFKAIAIAETANVLIYGVLSVSMLLTGGDGILFILYYYVGNLIEMLLLLGLDWKENIRMLWKSLCFGYRQTLWTVLKEDRTFLSLATLTRVTNFIGSNLPVLLMGMWVSASWQGSYYAASQFVLIPIALLTMPIGQVLYPTQAQKNSEQLKQSVFFYTRTIQQIVIPCYFSLIAFTVMGLQLFGGSKWEDSLMLVFPMSAIGIGMLLMMPVGSVPYILRKPGFELTWNIMSLGLKIIALGVGMDYSLVSAITLYSVVSLGTNVLFYLMTQDMLKSRWKEYGWRYLRDWIPMMIIAGICLFSLQLTMELRIAINTISILLYLFVMNGLTKGRILKEIKSWIPVLKVKGD